MSTNQEMIASLDQYEQVEGTFTPPSQQAMAYADIMEGLQQWRIWFMLAYQDIKLRYRRSVLGPFWITLSMAITVYTMGYLYGHLFHTELNYYYPFLASGMLCWALISSVIIDLTDTFILSDGLIKQIKLPYSLHIHRVIARNTIIFFHNLLVMIPIYFIFHAGANINWTMLLLIPGLLLLYINSFIYGLLLAIIGARFRDISQIIKSLVQVVFFVTPIMWNPNILPAHAQYFVYVNPVYSFVQLIRAPLIGHTPSLLNYGVVLLVTALGAFCCQKIFVRYRSRIIYWL